MNLNLLGNLEIPKPETELGLYIATGKKTIAKFGEYEGQEIHGYVFLPLIRLRPPYITEKYDLAVVWGTVKALVKSLFKHPRINAWLPVIVAEERNNLFAGLVGLDAIPTIDNLAGRASDGVDKFADSIHALLREIPEDQVIEINHRQFYCH